MCPARLFTVGAGELFFKESKIQGDPTSVVAYALGILPLLQFLLDFISVNEPPAKKLLLQMTLWLLGNYQALKTTGAN